MLKKTLLLLLVCSSCSLHQSRQIASLDDQSYLLEKIEELKPNCEDYSKKKKKEIAQLMDSDRDAYERYMSCKHYKKNEKRDHSGKCAKAGENLHTVSGKLSYGSAISPYLGPYRYDVIKEANGDTIIQVKIHFKSEFMQERLKKEHYPSEYKGIVTELTYEGLIDFYLQQASKLWTKNSPVDDVYFEFVRATESDAHFTVKYLDKEKGMLYNKYWTTHAKELEDRDEKQVYNRIFSHEIGHMLGLEDEINLLKGMTNGGYFLWKDGFHIDCSSASLMCVSTIKFTGKAPTPQPYHYNLILKRLQNCK